MRNLIAVRPLLLSSLTSVAVLALALPLVAFGAGRTGPGAPAGTTGVSGPGVEQQVRQSTTSGSTEQEGPLQDTAGRVLYAPRLGGDSQANRCQCHGQSGAVSCTCAEPDEELVALAPGTGVQLQNAGSESVRFLVAYFDEPPPTPGSSCYDCAIIGWSCTPPVAPGLTFSAPPFYGGPDASSPVTPTRAAAATVYSISTLVAREQGQEWAEWLDGNGYPEDTTVDSVVCDLMTAAHESPCRQYTSFHLAYLGDGDGLLPDTPLPIGPARGVPISGVATVLDTGRNGDSPVVDRFSLVPLRESGTLPHSGPASGEYRYVAAGGYGSTPDGTRSVLRIMNTATACAHVVVQPHRSEHGAFGDPLQIEVPPAGRASVALATHWPTLMQMASVSLSSDQPLAATISNLNFATSTTHDALRERTRETRWLAPRAYQEQRPVSSAAMGHFLPTSLLSAEGWETNMSIFNPASVEREVLLRMQASGQPPRGPIGYLVNAQSQRVLQPGFGLGLPGGPGWVELTSSGGPVQVGIESLRQATNVPMVIEAWSVSALAAAESAEVAEASVVISLPDLGVEGSEASTVQPGEAITDSLRTVIAIQNPITRTTRVAIDTFHERCGYVGSVERSIDPRQTVVLAVESLPGAALGANSALMRVIEGQAAAVVETTHTRWRVADPQHPPLDLSNAYRGGSVEGDFSAPNPISVTLSASPLTIEQPWPDRPVTRTIQVTVSHAPDRCVTFQASSDASWLSVSPGQAFAPSELLLTIDPDLIDTTGTSTGRVTITSDAPNVVGTPLVVVVRVEARPVPEFSVLIPAAFAP